MKGKLLIAVVVLLAFTSALYAGGGAEGASVVDIGYAVPDTTNPFVGWLTSSVKELAEADGIRVQIADAGNSPVKQIEQIENFIAMNVKVLAIMPVDPNNVQDVIQRAQAKGIKVLVAGTDTVYYDVMMNMDQYNAGEQIAEMGIAWLQDTYGATAANPAKVIVIKSTETVDMTNRSNGIIDTISTSPLAEVVISTKEAQTAAEGFAIMENLWLEHNDASLVLTYNADAALGVNEFIMGQAGVDKANFAIFSGDWSDPIQEIMDLSSTNDSVFRGTMQIVGPRINGEQWPLELATYTLLKDLFEGNLTYGNIIRDAIAKAYPAQ